MKSGTSTLHAALAAHPGLYLPPSEVFFFDFDDLDQNPDSLPVGRARGSDLADWDRNLDAYLRWYKALFAPARPDQLVGEDSTTYLASAVAPTRISGLIPGVRLIFLLRDPVTRAYSHYWHLVRTGRAVFCFEDTLRLAPEQTLRRGFYRQQLTRYFELFSTDQIGVWFFEDLIADPPALVDDVLAYLGLAATASDLVVPVENPGGVILSGGFNRLFNAVAGHRVNRHGFRVPTVAGETSRTWRSGGRLRRAARRTSQALLRPYPPMADETREVLRRVYCKENAGLSDLLGTDVSTRWPWFDG